ncbi:alternative ribosome rescue aminoacyl-tRNA hydrolase ArfB [Propionibacteriaceae bacterium Y1700]|uniref:alternative ribosome rescue aminoacyl-tRNA hydrolase ArfB n=1 Tax=Microlunatus sp. Y1700 TaxID=3418487 RepID=UPI003DA6F70E
MLPGPGVPDGLVIPSAELTERFSRSPGPGGQSVNTTDSRVELIFDVQHSATLTKAQCRRICERLANRIVGGTLVLVATGERSQWRNRLTARERLAELLRTALAPPPPKRRATRPTRGSRRRRLEHKRQRSQTKALRGRVDPGQG